MLTKILSRVTASTSRSVGTNSSVTAPVPSTTSRQAFSSASVRFRRACPCRWRSGPARNHGRRHIRHPSTSARRSRSSRRRDSIALRAAASEFSAKRDLACLQAAGAVGNDHDMIAPCIGVHQAFAYLGRCGFRRPRPCRRTRRADPQRSRDANSVANESLRNGEPPGGIAIADDGGMKPLRVLIEQGMTGGAEALRVRFFVALHSYPANSFAPRTGGDASVRETRGLPHASKLDRPRLHRDEEHSAAPAIRPMPARCPSCGANTPRT